MVADAKKAKVQVPAPDADMGGTTLPIADGDPGSGAASSGGSGSAQTRTSASGGTKRGAEPVGAVSPGQRRLRHAITGVNKTFRDNVVVALNDLELTKSVAELQAVMDQVTKVSVELQQHVNEQEAQAALTLERAEAAEERLRQLEKSTTGHFKAVDAKLTKLAHDQGNAKTSHGNDKDELFTKLAVQEAVLTERIEEIKGLFKKCDDVFEHTGSAKPASTPATTSVAGAPPGLTDPGIPKAILKEAKAANELLRGAVDAMQVEINQLRVETLECRDLNVPLQVELQEQSSSVETFQQWVVQEVIEGRDRHDQVTKHAASAFDELRDAAKLATEQLRTEIANAACPCPPGCKGKAANEPDGTAPL